MIQLCVEAKPLIIREPLEARRAYWTSGFPPKDYRGYLWGWQACFSCGAYLLAIPAWKRGRPGTRSNLLTFNSAITNSDRASSAPPQNPWSHQSLLACPLQYPCLMESLNHSSPRPPPPLWRAGHQCTVIQVTELSHWHTINHLPPHKDKISTLSKKKLWKESQPAYL